MFHIRPFEVTDTPAILDIYAPFILTGGVSFETELPALAQFEKRLLEIASKYPFFVACKGNQVCGYAYACRHRERDAYRWIAETSVYIHPDFYHQGLAEKLYTLLLDTLKTRNFVWAFAGITLPNPGSLALHHKMGFEEFAQYPNAGWKQNQWYDVVWLRKQINPAIQPPTEPIFQSA